MKARKIGYGAASEAVWASDKGAAATPLEIQKSKI
jgi:hypothetical protein